MSSILCYPRTVFLEILHLRFLVQQVLECGLKMGVLGLHSGSTDSEFQQRVCEPPDLHFKLSTLVNLMYASIWEPLC